MHLENENKRKVKTENKTHQGKRACNVYFCRTFISSLYLLLELAGSNLAQNLLRPFKVIWNRLFLLIVPVVFVNAERCSVNNRVVFIKPLHNSTRFDNVNAERFCENIRSSRFSSFDGIQIRFLS